jgi:signal transduction histidine kinase
MSGPPSEPQEHPLSAFLRRQRDDIVAEWARAVCALPVARDLVRPRLIDHVPFLLDCIADDIDAMACGRAPTSEPDAADRHALERLGAGYDLNELVAEYSILRDTILVLIEQWQVVREPGIRLLHAAIDRGIGASVARYVQSRGRTLEALDRLSSFSLAARSLEELLQGLLQVFLEAAPSAETASILLCEGDELVLRAAVGLEQDIQQSFRLAIGEGFAGTIAARRAPLSLRDAANDPLVRSPVLKAVGIRALFGAPLLEDGRLVGVAHMGSAKVDEFTGEDRRVFLALARRAAAAIEQHALRDALDAERRRYSALVENLDHAVVWQADASSLRFEYVSSRAEHVTGFPSDAWLADPNFFERHVPEEDWPRLSALFDHCASAFADGLVDHRFRRRDGRELLVQTGVHCTKVSGRPMLQGVMVDVSALRDALHAREEVLSVVSHDLRNPLSVITLNAGLIVGALQAEQRFVRQRRSAEVILRTVTRMARMIDDLLDMASIESGRITVHRSTEDSRDLIDEAIANFASAAADNGVALSADLDTELAPVLCDRDRVMQVFSNVLGNAVKVTRAGGAITVRAAAQDGFVRFSVQDTGPGIRKEDLGAIFERYYRGATGKYRGLGLGLAIAKGIVAAHGGEIWAESEFGAGSTFHFTLPAEGPQPEAT